MQDSSSIPSATSAENDRQVSERVHHTLVETPLGQMHLAAREDALIGAWFTGQAHFPAKHHLGEKVEPSRHPILEQAARELEEYFAKERKSFEVPLAPDGTDFQLAVWESLKDIPFGYTTTYGAISKIVGPGAPAQAVGQAVGHNKVSIFIPCHRVLSADGKLTGYAGGVERKQYLLDLEAPNAAEEGRLF
ncbi:methylated-DNA--[protein]-cysteine S-methyltransferase [Rothia sp. ZJ1223]|uniref:methylated-DNA--[protein]-cysteine S-methyltransferase n=1 Tax=Rothia sp. ZJ1223 TaxID=2811098 RepID=UPI00195B3803|nr:methylated-DNA--[protein]-cysteine S-methyltransferase [Rothia sp. ZJ1223]MBM7050794.1 methylated-DNA--[protein]-cysteine S-methyltransferase [Rothia sp. ZJ1223]